MAGRGRVRVIMDFNRLPEAEANMDHALTEIKRRMAQDTVEEARARARVRTGAMRDSVRVSGEGAKTTMVTAGGINGVNYAAYNEYGTSRMSAQPFMRPAAEIVRARAAAGVYSDDLEDLVLP